MFIINLVEHIVLVPDTCLSAQDNYVNRIRINYVDTYCTVYTVRKVWRIFLYVTAMTLLQSSAIVCGVPVQFSQMERKR